MRDALSYAWNFPLPLFYVFRTTKQITIKKHEEKLSTFTLRNNTFSMSINRHKYERHLKTGAWERERATRSHNTWHAFLQAGYVNIIQNEWSWENEYSFSSQYNRHIFSLRAAEKKHSVTYQQTRCLAGRVFRAWFQYLPMIQRGSLSWQVFPDGNKCSGQVPSPREKLSKIVNQSELVCKVWSKTRDCHE